MKQSEREQMYKEIVRHGNNLLNIFPGALIQEPILLCKKLRTFELQAEQHTTTMCNGGSIERMKFAEKAIERIEKQVKKILSAADDQIFINHDPRGYALKLDCKFSGGKLIYKDWGGYGIIAPDFTPNK